MRGLSKVTDVFRKLGLVLVVVFFIATTVNAYTVVMRGGRRVEVPPTFVLTASTLTYEVSPGVQVTLVVAAIDIPATEKANGEPAGSFMKRAAIGTPEAVDLKAPAAQARTITNRNLESIARRRQESELAYEARRKQLGLPTVAETRRRAAADAESFAMELKERRLAEDQAEGYWRERATALRTDIAAVDAELAYVRARLDEGYLGSNNAWSSVSVTNYGLGWPFSDFGRWSFGNRGYGGRSYGRRSHRNIYVSRQQGRSSTRGRGGFNPGFRRHGGYLGGNQFPPFGNVGVLNAGVPVFDDSYERNELITRFNELGAERAALIARFRELEEEARRAGAPPGWLRP